MDNLIIIQFVGLFVTLRIYKSIISSQEMKVKVFFPLSTKETKTVRRCYHPRNITNIALQKIGFPTPIKESKVPSRELTYPDEKEHRPLKSALQVGDMLVIGGKQSSKDSIFQGLETTRC